MNKEQALKITVDTLQLDGTLRGEQVNLNRATFFLSELSYGRKHVGDSWHHVVPAHRNSDGTVRRDIVQLAAEIAGQHYTATQIVAAATGKLSLAKA